jgi:deoxyribose-phosphate aldolase
VPPLDVARFARLFDHSILRPDAGPEEVGRFAGVAIRLGTATLTVQPHYVQFAAERLRGTGVRVGAVIAFPHGNETTAMKAFQAREVLDHGADEIDMVMNIPALKGGEMALFLRDIEGVVLAAHGKTVKVILENCYLTQDEKRRACEWIAQAGAQFVKTSTGFAATGATVEDVRLMHEVVKGRCQVKASGGIRDIRQVMEYLKAGARRFGSSRTEELVLAFEELSRRDREALAEYLPAPD